MKLKNDELTVEFKPEGATISSIKDRDGVEYLWQGNPEYWGGQAPVLFPICGSLRNDVPLFRLVKKQFLDPCLAMGLSENALLI